MEIIEMFIIPVLILVIGCVSKYRPAKKINSLFGYRSKRSKASQENWDLAQLLMSKYLLIIGGAEAVLTAVCCFFLKDRAADEVLLIMAIVTALQVIGLLIVIPLVEKDLKAAEE